MGEESITVVQEGGEPRPKGGSRRCRGICIVMPKIRVNYIEWTSLRSGTGYGEGSPGEGMELCP